MAIGRQKNGNNQQKPKNNNLKLFSRAHKYSLWDYLTLELPSFPAFEIQSWQVVHIGFNAVYMPFFYVPCCRRFGKPPTTSEALCGQVSVTTHCFCLAHLLT